ncbi:RNA polymerase sigma factor [Paenibacillus sp. WLX2291]|uniref:RNA polymerase sigma factor n=1 Tax=Paenibacillus sp. WLX2291 TaxID=3296934 RepID=UPI0039844200
MDDRELFETYRESVYRYCLYMTGNPADAEDICQEVFIKALLAKRDHITHEKAWLLRIAANECHTQFHRRTSRKRREQRAFTLHLPLLSGKSVETQIEHGETVDEFAKLLNHLSVPLREVLLLYYMGECSTTETAEILNIPVGTVKSRLNRALKKLRKYSTHFTDDAQKGSDIHAKMG